MIGTVAVSPARKLEDLIRLAELCVDLLRQNEEFYAEVTSYCHCQLKSVRIQCCNLVKWDSRVKLLGNVKCFFFVHNTINKLSKSLTTTI